MFKKYWIIIIFIVLLIGGYFISQSLTSDKKVVPVPNQTQENIDLSEKVGQMIMIGFRGTTATADSYIEKVITEVDIGGVVLFDKDIPSGGDFPRNIENFEQVKQLTSDLQKHTKTPLFIGIDVEGGWVNRLKEKYGFIEIPSAKEMGQMGFDVTENTAKKLAEQLSSIGINMDFAPVVDLDINPDNPIIGGIERAFSADPLQVTGHAKGFIEGLRTQNIIAVVKHFPGHGSSLGDSHKGLVDVTDTYTEVELFPYFLLQKEGVLDAVMTAHIINQKIDEEYPATLSSIFVNDVLRHDIGFTGVVISDDLQMEAITKEYSLETAVIKTVNAGVNILLLSNNSTQEYDEQLPYTVKNIIMKAVKDGEITETRINESYIEIMNLKKKFEIIKVAE